MCRRVDGLSYIKLGESRGECDCVCHRERSDHWEAWFACVVILMLFGKRGQLMSESCEDVESLHVMIKS